MGNACSRCLYPKERVDTMPPTEKQISFVNAIAERLNIERPYFDRLSYSRFIDKYRGEFYKASSSERKKLDEYLKTVSTGYWQYF